LRSGNIWLRYSSFSAILRLKWKRGPTLEYFRTLQNTLTKQDNVSKMIQTSNQKSETAWFVAENASAPLCNVS